MARAHVLGGGRAAERLYLQSGAIVLGALLMAWRARKSTTRCAHAAALMAGATPVASGRLEAMVAAPSRGLLTGIGRCTAGSCCIADALGTITADLPRVGRGTALGQRLHPRSRWCRALLVRRRPATGQLPRGRIGQLDEVRARERFAITACRHTCVSIDPFPRAEIDSICDEVDASARRRCRSRRVRPARRRRRPVRRQLAPRVPELRRDGDAHRGDPLAPRGSAGRHPRHLPARGLPTRSGPTGTTPSSTSSRPGCSAAEEAARSCCPLTTSAVSPSSIASATRSGRARRSRNVERHGGAFWFRTG